MRKRARLWPAIFCGVVIAALVWFLAEWSFVSEVSAGVAELESYDRRDGKAEAEQDIERGALKWKVRGRVSDFQTRQKIVREKLGVELDWFADCEGTDAVVRYGTRYNSTMRAHLISQLGAPLVAGVLGDAPAEESEIGNLNEDGDARRERGH
jgi:hypothetical protein